MKTATAKKPEENHAVSNARCWLASIREMVAKLNAAQSKVASTAHPSACDLACDAADAAHQTIQESPLEISVRDGWRNPGMTDRAEATEYKILLSTGGPALRIIGELERNEPRTATLEHQDWGTPWMELTLTEAEEADLLTFAQQFYFGE